MELLALHEDYLKKEVYLRMLHTKFHGKITYSTISFMDNYDAMGTSRNIFQQVSLEI